MKYVCVSMSKKEHVLDSYLARVFYGHVIRKETCKTVRFPEENLTWTPQMLRNFCESTVSDKAQLKVYRAKILSKEVRS